MGIAGLGQQTTKVFIATVSPLFYLISNIQFSTLWCPAAFEDFRKKTPKRMWLCVGISPVRYALQAR